MARSDRRPRRAFQEAPHAGHPIVYIVKGSAVSIIVSLLFSVFLAVISLVTDLASIERYMPYIMLGATICSVFVGSVYAAQQARAKGLLIGVGVGVAYVLAAALFDMQMSTESLSMLVFGKKLAVAAVTGAVGGMVGTNL